MAPAGRHNPKTRSPTLLFITLSFLAISFLYFIFSTFSSSPSSHTSSQNPNLNLPKPDYSFVSSLDKFLTTPISPSKSDDTFVSPTGDDNVDVNKFDSSIWKTETRRLYDPSSSSFYPPPLIRVYVYEMPSKFTYDLLWLFRNTYRDTSNLTSNGSPVHRLIEQHSIDYWLWADLIAPESERLLKNVVRVHKQEEADLFYIPFFTTISFFLLEKQQCKALYRVKL